MRGCAAMTGETPVLRTMSTPRPTYDARIATPRAAAYDQLLEQLETLPGIGRRSAERIAVHLLRQPETQAVALGESISRFVKDLKSCSVCGHVAEVDPCPICSDPKRDAGLVLVVEQPSDVISIEQSGAYRGRYHVLMGRFAPLEAMGPGDLNIASLERRVRQGLDDARPDDPPIREVVLGTQPTLEGDGTAMLLAQRLEPLGVTVTRLARGLPTGVSLQSVSKAVLSHAIQDRA